jgi:hypothetical protein
MWDAAPANVHVHRFAHPSSPRCPVRACGCKYFKQSICPFRAAALHVSWSHGHPASCNRRSSSKFPNFAASQQHEALSAAPSSRLPGMISFQLVTSGARTTPTIAISVPMPTFFCLRPSVRPSRRPSRRPFVRPSRASGCDERTRRNVETSKKEVRFLQ